LVQLRIAPKTPKPHFILINCIKMEEIKSVWLYLFGHLGRRATKNLEDLSDEEKQWYIYNYPPCINIINYSTDGLEQPILRIVRVLNANVWIILSV